ncbi:MAG TPA: hypothetical protein VKI00_28475 [Mycobacterium sp.]|uniref:hypothetical protein n=1 Tax=Mycobacterium sp. TaxID=1785 RepID=UPI002B7DBDCB|nr:hypothetical protein [Mycobacterium sp.]HME79457.1 hypothetical protein [Mycobacterium sp.]
MRDLETIDSELRLLTAVRWSIREHGGEPSSRQVDELLDERLKHRGRLGEEAAVDTEIATAKRAVIRLLVPTSAGWLRLAGGSSSAVRTRAHR